MTGMTEQEIVQELGDAVIVRQVAWRVWDNSGDRSDRDNKREAREAWEWYTAAAQRILDLTRALLAHYDAKYPPT